MSFLKLESGEALNAVSMDSYIGGYPSIYRNGQSLVRGACGSRSTQPASQPDRRISAEVYCAETNTI